MKCICCDKKLSDFEATRKHAVTGAYLDMCNRCLQGLDIPTKDRIDLLTEADCGENTTDSDEETLDKSGEFVYNNNYIDTEE